MDKYNLNVKKVPKLKITSHIFKDMGDIPDVCCSEGQNLFPTLDIKKIPIETDTLVLIMEDIDTKKETGIHIVAWNIPVISEEVTINEEVLKNVKKGVSDFGVRRWLGPCPPEGEKKHHYCFKIYGLDRKINMVDNSTKADLLKKISKYKILVAYGEINGVYGR